MGSLYKRCWPTAITFSVYNFAVSDDCVLNQPALFIIFPFSQDFRAGNFGRREGAKVNITATVRATFKAGDSDGEV
jgi:hypothetical protein